MLTFAFDYCKERIKDRMSMIRYVDYFKYYNHRSWFDSDIDIEPNTWSQIQMVSEDKTSLCGFMGARLNRDANNVDDIYAINFRVNDYVFAKDFREFLSSLFLKYKFNKVSFRSIVDNPANKMYQKIVDRYGGRVVGIKIKEVKLPDGELYDEILYEIMREDFMEKWEDN